MKQQRQILLSIKKTEKWKLRLNCQGHGLLVAMGHHRSKEQRESRAPNNRFGATTF
jgi:hypothetical protein